MRAQPGTAVPQPDLYAMLAGTSRAINRCESPDELFREVCRLVVETGRLRFAWVGTRHLGSVRAVAAAGEDSGYLDELIETDLMITLNPDELRGQGPTGRALSTGVRVVANDFLASSGTRPWHDAARRAGFRASASFPLREGGAVTAALTVYAGSVGFFTPALLDTLGEVTPAISLALDRFALNALRIEQNAQADLRRSALNALGHSFAIADARARDQPLVYVSEGFEAMTGYTASEIHGQNCRLLQGPQTDPQAARRLGQAIRDGLSATVELLNYTKAGEPFWNRITLAPIRDDRGTITHFAGSQLRIERPTDT